MPSSLPPKQLNTSSSQSADFSGCLTEIELSSSRLPAVDIGSLSQSSDEGSTTYNGRIHEESKTLMLRAQLESMTEYILDPATSGPDRSLAGRCPRKLIDAAAHPINAIL